MSCAGLNDEEGGREKNSETILGRVSSYSVLWYVGLNSGVCTEIKATVSKKKKKKSREKDRTSLSASLQHSLPATLVIVETRAYLPYRYSNFLLPAATGAASLVSHPQSSGARNLQAQRDSSVILSPFLIERLPHDTHCWPGLSFVCPKILLNHFQLRSAQVQNKEFHCSCHQNNR